MNMNGVAHHRNRRIGIHQLDEKLHKLGSLFTHRRCTEDFIGLRIDHDLNIDHDLSLIKPSVLPRSRALLLSVMCRRPTLMRRPFACFVSL